jgi:hypothetical protein
LLEPLAGTHATPWGVDVHARLRASSFLCIRQQVSYPAVPCPWSWRFGSTPPSATHTPLGESPVSATTEQEAGTRQAEEANSSGQDGQQVVLHAWVCRLNLMTFGTGHSWTHRAQAVQASALTTYACLLRWTHALNRSPSDRSRLSAVVKERISRTEYGQAGTQGHLASAQAWWYPPSHLVRSIIGTKSPGFCSFLIWLTLFHLGHERQRVA